MYNLVFNAIKLLMMEAGCCGVLLPWCTVAMWAANPYNTGMIHHCLDSVSLLYYMLFCWYLNEDCDIYFVNKITWKLIMILCFCFSYWHNKMKFCYKVNVQCSQANLCFVRLLPVFLFKVTNLQVQSYFHDSLRSSQDLL